MKKIPAAAKIWNADVPVAMRALFQLDYGNPLAGKLIKMKKELNLQPKRCGNLMQNKKVKKNYWKVKVKEKVNKCATINQL